LKEIVEICRKSVASRTLEDILNIIRAKKEFPSFQEFAGSLDEDQLIVFCLCLKLKTLESYEPLCRLGEQPYEVFYILDGKIAVTNVNESIYNEKALTDRIFHIETKGSTLGEASILYNSCR
jgi:hypothetical protein